MKLHERIFRVYLLLGKKPVAPLYDYSVWMHAISSLEPLLEQTRGEPQVVSRQVHQNTHKYISFGRLSLSDESYRKWTHNSPTTHEVSEHWLFQYTSIYCPSWQTSVKEDKAPDVFFELQKTFHPHGTPAWDQEVLLAAARDLELSQYETNSVFGLKDLLGECETYYCESAWGEPFGETGFADFIEAYLQTRMGVVRSHKMFPKPNELNGKWCYFDPCRRT